MKEDTLKEREIEYKMIDFRGKKVKAQRYIAVDRSKAKELDDDLWVVTEEAKKEAGL